MPDNSAIKGAWPLQRTQVESLWAELQQARGDIEELVKVCSRIENDRDKLQAFKSWVHAWLDSYGVPKEFPDGPHTREGCRIGDRMEWLRNEHYRRENAVMEDCLAKIKAIEKERDIARGCAGWLGSYEIEMGKTIKRLEEERDKAKEDAILYAGHAERFELERNEIRNRLNAVADERDAACEHAVGLSCFSCGVRWKPSNNREKCDQAHRETWEHEWVSTRVKELTQLLLDANADRNKLRDAIVQAKRQGWTGEALMALDQLTK